MSTTPTKPRGYLAVPKNSLNAQIELLQRILEGMQKHKADPDYPTVLDTFGVQAEHDMSFIKAGAAAAMKVNSKRATAEAIAQRTMNGVNLETIREKLIGAYGAKNPVLYDYGFRVPSPRKPAKRTAGKTRRPRGGTSAPVATGPAAAATSGSTAGAAPASTPASPAGTAARA